MIEATIYFFAIMGALYTMRSIYKLIKFLLQGKYM